MLKPDADVELLKLRPNYRDAIRAVPAHHRILPSVNLIDGKAKQFDDGLHAALEQHWFQARAGEFRGDLDFLRQLAAAMPVDSKAAAYLAVGLELAEISVPATNQAAKSAWKAPFESRELNTKPLGFYSWRATLQQCYRVGRFFQMGIPLKETEWMQPMIDVLRNDSALQADYRRILARWARLSNLPLQLTVLNLADQSDEERAVSMRHAPVHTVSLFPAGTNRESELVRRVFPTGFSASDDLMRELVAAIRSGQVNLKPTDKSGWYDYQVYALETLIVPGRGDRQWHFGLGRS